MWKSINYSCGKLQEMLAMTTEYYGKDNDIAKEEFIQHEYFRNHAGDAVIKLAYDEEKDVLAGQYVVIPVKIKVGNEICQAILSLNTLTKEAYRGQKIFTSLAEEVYQECKEKGYKFCYGAPNPNSHPGFLKKLKFKDAIIMPLFLKIVHPSVLVREKMNSRFLESMTKPFNAFFYPTKTKNEREVETINRRNVFYFDMFWEDNKNKYHTMGVRDAEYMKWRYIDMPFREYEIKMVIENGKPKGYIVGRITEVADMKCGMIVDFMVEKNREDIGKLLISNMEQFFYKKGAGLLGSLMQKQCEEAGYLHKAGFFVCPKRLEPQPFPIIYRELNDESGLETIPDFSQWFFTMGDYDVI